MEARETVVTVCGYDFVRAGPAPLIRPGARGSYALVLRLDQPTRLDVGRLGTHSLEPGTYVYCGSALGGLRGRIARHLRAEKRLHWHVDYLLRVARIRIADVWVCEAPERLECRLAAHLSSLPHAFIRCRASAPPTATVRAISSTSPGRMVLIRSTGSGHVVASGHLTATVRPSRLPHSPEKQRNERQVTDSFAPVGYSRNVGCLVTRDGQSTSDGRRSSQSGIARGNSETDDTRKGH